MHVHNQDKNKRNKVATSESVDRNFPHSPADLRRAVNGLWLDFNILGAVVNDNSAAKDEAQLQLLRLMDAIMGIEEISAAMNREVRA
jgi:hypothetical protein